MEPSDETEDAIRALYGQHANDIYRYAALTLGDRTTAKDVVQEVFLRAFRSWDTFRRDADPKTWLRSIARNYMLDVLRKRQIERSALADLDPGATPDVAVSVANRLMLIQALSKLKDTYRHVFVLRHVEHCSVAETAQVMGWSESNVKTTDQRAIAKMREILGAFEEGDLS